MSARRSAIFCPSRSEADGRQRRPISVSTTIRAARWLGVSLADQHQLVEPRERLDLPSPLGAVAQERHAAPSASFSGVQSAWRNSGIAFSPRTRLVRTIEGTLTTYFSDALRLRHAVGDDHRHAGQDRARASPCPRPPAPRGRAERPPTSPASPRTSVGFTDQLALSSRSPRARCSTAGMVTSSGRAKPLRARRQGLPEGLHQPAHLGAAASGQDQELQRDRRRCRAVRPAAGRRSSRRSIRGCPT